MIVILRLNFKMNARNEGIKNEEIKYLIPF